MKTPFGRMLLGAALIMALTLPGIVSWTSPAAAGLISYSVSSTCTTNCSAIGLSSGDSIGGTITFDDTNFAAGAAISETDINSFLLTFGTAVIEETTAAAVAFVGVLAADAMTFASFSFTAAQTLSGAGDVIDLVFSDWQASINGRCATSACGKLVLKSSAEGGAVQVSNQASASPSAVVPEPATGLLFLGGLFCLAALTRLPKVSRSSRRATV
ncbi:MAG: hypothetical protein MI920_01285 [Kiloniellales bacterium]|nr:hypothetical protein [Kiloniellales bacterium]